MSDLAHDRPGLVPLLVLLTIVAVVILLGLAGLGAMVLYIQQGPGSAAPPGASNAAPPVAIGSRGPVPTLNTPLGQGIPLYEPAQGLLPTDLKAAHEVVLSYYGALRLNDIETLQGLSSATLLKSEIGGRQRDQHLYMTGFSSPLKLIGMQSKQEGLYLQYRTDGVKGRPCDVIFKLVQEDTVFKIDDVTLIGQAP